MANRLRESLDIPFAIDDLLAYCTCSVGLVLFNDAEKSKKFLMKQADIALYKAKNKGRNFFLADVEA